VIRRSGFDPEKSNLPPQKAVFQIQIRLFPILIRIQAFAESGSMADTNPGKGTGIFYENIPVDNKNHRIFLLIYLKRSFRLHKKSQALQKALQTGKFKFSPFWGPFLACLDPDFDVG
jgi:hypothetical protein